MKTQTKEEKKVKKSRGRVALKILGVTVLVIAVLAGAVAAANFISTNANIISLTAAVAERIRK